MQGSMMMHEMRNPRPSRPRRVVAAISGIALWAWIAATAARAGEAAQWWSFQPPGAQSVPAVRGKDWATSPIDHFVLARLEEKGLSPAPIADKRTLVRRATFDLTGLPPT